MLDVPKFSRVLVVSEVFRVLLKPLVVSKVNLVNEQISVVLILFIYCLYTILNWLYFYILYIFLVFMTIVFSFLVIVCDFDIKKK